MCMVTDDGGRFALSSALAEAHSAYKDRNECHDNQCRPQGAQADANPVSETRLCIVAQDFNAGVDNENGCNQHIGGDQDWCVHELFHGFCSRACTIRARKQVAYGERDVNSTPEWAVVMPHLGDVHRIPTVRNRRSKSRSQAMKENLKAGRGGAVYRRVLSVLLSLSKGSRSV